MEAARTWLPRVVAVTAFAIFAAAVPPEPGWLAAADGAAAAAALGAPETLTHPGHVGLAAVATLIPIGEIAFRVHLFSALAGALALYALARLALAAGRDDAVALVAAAVAAAAALAQLPFLRAATLAGSGAPAAALGALALFLLVRVARGEGAPIGLGLALVSGLGLAIHPAFVALLPVVAALYWQRLRRGARWPLAAPLLMVGTAASATAYLPIRAAASEERALVPVGISDVPGHILGPLRPESLQELASNLAAAARGGAAALGPGLVLAALGGALALALGRRERWLAAAAAALAAGELYAIAAQEAAGARVGGIGPIGAVVAAVCAGAGVAWFGRALGRAGPYAAAAAGAIALTPAVLATYPAVAGTASGTGTGAIVRALDETAPPGASVRLERDTTRSALRYAALTYGVRPDLDVGAWRPPSGRGEVAPGGAGELAPGGAGELAPGGAGEPPDLEGADAAALARDRALVWELGATEPAAAYGLRVGAPPFALRVADGDGGGDLEAAAERLASDAPGDPEGARVFAEIFLRLGELADARGEDGLARALIGAAAALDPARPDARARSRELGPQ